MIYMMTTIFIYVFQHALVLLPILTHYAAINCSMWTPCCNHFAFAKFSLPWDCGRLHYLQEFILVIVNICAYTWTPARSVHCTTSCQNIEILSDREKPNHFACDFDCDNKPLPNFTLTCLNCCRWIFYHFNNCTGACLDWSNLLDWEVKLAWRWSNSN